MLIEKHINLKGQSIRVCISGEGASSIVFVHGNSCSADFYREQLVDPFLAEKYQLIAFDLPGHGSSGKTEDYSPKALASLIPAIIEELKIDRYLLAGLSYGTCLIAEAAPALRGCRGFLLAAPNITNDAHPPSAFIKPFSEAYALASPEVPEEVLMGFAGLMVYRQDSPLIDEYRNSYLHTDPAFRIAVGKAIMTADWSDQWANLANTGLPTCLIFGKEEKMITLDYLDPFPAKWGDQVYYIEQAAHLVNMEQPEDFNRILGLFAQDTLG